MNQDEALKVWENKMKNSFPDYPCTDCTVDYSRRRIGCTCCKWKSWYSKHWKNIRERAKTIKEVEMK